MKMTAVNGKLILEPYKGSGKIEGNVRSGYATIKQKDTLVGLTLLADGRVIIGKDMLEVKKGQKVYFSEEILHASPWSKKTYHLEGKEEQFILAEAIHVMAVE